MAQIPKDTVEQVLLATDIAELIGSYIPVKRQGSQFKALCPFHNEKTPSFTINPHRQTFHCFGCGKGGDAIAFIREYENLPFTDAVQRLAQRAGITVVETESNPQEERARRARGRLLDLHRESAAFFHRLLMKDPAAAHARAYMKSREFGPEMAKRWQVGWMPENPKVFLDWAREQKYTGRELLEGGLVGLKAEGNPRAGVYVRFRDRLMFPISNEIGDVVAFTARKLNEAQPGGKYINSIETAIFRKSNILFGLDRARKAILKEKSALLCEGQLDAICCHEAGVEQAIATSGTACTQQHARLLKRYTKAVLLCFDGDGAGIAASQRAFGELVAEGLSVKMVQLPSGDDPDSFLRAHGVEAFRRLLENADDFFEAKLKRARKNGDLDSAAERAVVVNDCANLLAAMSDPVARDHQINVVASHLQLSSSALRQAIAQAKKQADRRAPAESPDVPDSQQQAEPTPMHRIVSWISHLALSSGPAQHFLAEQFETLHEASRWLEGVPLLEKILAVAPDPRSSAAVNAFIGGLPEKDRLALLKDPIGLEGAPDDGMQAAEHALALLSATVLHKRDAAVKAALREPGLKAERMMELLEEAKEISSLMRGIGQRSEFDDELPASTWKPKTPPWKKWNGKKA
ncbi:DNA primase [Luteolibacter pohnpeiensis]|uniref:DNA primase n=1 Tax=Luteolibacter pohnpeiensis TaxID=454153 RepID=A0A934VVH2_9BACT|nr:DNA primase [Luteolibacter pohnpeiensis]MBK1881524.1 DNA primase [Luteolibacter pohnpeiensis]